MKTMYEQAVDWIRRNMDKHGDAALLMRRAKASKPSWYKLLQGKDVRAETLFRWLDNLGFTLVTPDKEKPGSGDALTMDVPVDGAGIPGTGRPLDSRAQKRRIAELEGKLALLRDLYAKSLDELTDLKAESRHLRRMYGRDLLPAREERNGTDDHATRHEDDTDYGMAQEEPAGYGVKSGAKGGSKTKKNQPRKA